MFPIALVNTGPIFPAAESVRLEILKESLVAGVPVPLKLTQDLHKPCARLVVAEPPSLSTVKPFVKLVNGTIIPYAYGLSPRVAVSQADLSFAIVSALSIADAPGASLNAFFLFTEAVLAELSSASKAFI